MTAATDWVGRTDKTTALERFCHAIRHEPDQGELYADYYTMLQKVPEDAAKRLNDEDVEMQPQEYAASLTKIIVGFLKDYNNGEIEKGSLTPDELSGLMDELDEIMQGPFIDAMKEAVDELASSRQRLM